MNDVLPISERSILIAKIEAEEKSKQTNLVKLTFVLITISQLPLLVYNNLATSLGLQFSREWPQVHIN